MQIPQKIENISIKWFFQAPFLSEFLMRMTYMESKSIPTMGIGFKQNYLTIWYNTEFVNSLSDKQLEGVLVHEIMHILTMSFNREKTRDPQRWNIATDITINEEILTQFTIRGEKLELPKNGCSLEQIKVEGYEGATIAEEIYNWMEKTGKGGSYTTVDVHDFLDSLTEEQKIKVQQIIETAQKRSYGSMSSNFEIFVKKLMKPKGISLHQLLRNSIQEQFFGKNQIEYNWSAKNRRNNNYLPGKKYYSNKLNVVFDTSGSCYNQDILSLFFSEMDSMSSQIEEINLIQFDTEVKNVTRYKKGIWKQIKVMGGGGTDIQPVFNYLRDKKLTKFPTVIFTDGEFDWNLKNFNVLPLWVLTQKCTTTFGRQVVLVKE